MCHIKYKLFIGPFTIKRASVNQFNWTYFSIGFLLVGTLCHKLWQAFFNLSQSYSKVLQMKSSTSYSNQVFHQLSQVMQEQEAFPITDNLLFATVVFYSYSRLKCTCKFYMWSYAVYMQYHMKKFCRMMSSLFLVS